MEVLPGYDLSVPSRFRELCLPAAERAALLQALIRRVQRWDGEARPVLVFDLDATLLDNRPRHAAILAEWARTAGDRLGAAADDLAALDLARVAYEVGDTLRGLGIDDQELLEHAEAFWAERYFTDRYLQHDRAMPGAAAFVQDLYRHGANVVYLTGRDIHAMALGTVASLRDLGFPIGRVGTELVIKPDAELSDVDFKRTAAADLARVGVVLASFDNEPANCHGLLDAHPDSTAVLLATLHAPDGPAPRADVRVIDSFEV